MKWILTRKFTYIIPIKMNTKSLGFFLPLFVLSHSFDDLHARNKTLLQDFRQPRVTGRIVKVYSGNRPQPIVCPGEGFQPDPVDCSVFYRCVVSTHGKYTSFRFQCSPGTIYDPDSEVCNFPQNTRRSECGGILAQFVPRHYSKELDNAKNELPTPIINVPYFEGMVIKDKQSTINPFSATSKRQAIQSTFSSAVPWAQSTLYQTSKPSKTLSVMHSRNSQNGDPCTTDGFLGDSKDCQKFYRCVSNLRGGFIRYEFICSDNTIWDEDAKSCNHAWAVQRHRCGSGSTLKRTVSDSNTQPLDGDNVPNKTIQEQLQVNYGSKVSQTQTQISNVPGVLQNQTQINYEDRVNNKKEPSIKQNQTQISHGSAVSQSQTQINYENKGIQTQLQIDHTKEASQSQTQIENDSEQDTEQSSVSPSSGNASNECTQSGFMGDKKDCKKFYRCVDNGKGSYTKYEFSCGEGTIWDSNIEGCNHAWAVKDCGGKPPSSNNSQNHQFMTTTSASVSTQNSHTTSGPATDDEEEVDNAYGNQNPTFENNTQSSSTTLTVQNKPSTETIVFQNNECSSTGFVGDNNDCKKFYRCVDNGHGSYTKYEFKCGEGTVWDPEIEACNHAWAVKKCGGSFTADNTLQVETTTKTYTVLTTVTLVQTTTEISGPNNDDEAGYGQQQNESPSTTTASTKLPHNDETNKCKSNGFIGDKKNCKKFYRCVDEGNGVFTRYEFSCGEGTVWDPKIEACNHPWAVEHCGEDKTDLNKETTTVKDIEENTSSSSTESQITSTKQPSSVTTKKPTSETQCETEGFVGDTNDCKIFYRCVDSGRGGFIKYEFTCGEGTVWDPEISTCNYPTRNHSCSGVGSEPTNTDVEKESDEMYTETTTTKSITSTEFSGNTASTTHKPQTVDKRCKSEGFYNDPDNCKKFYRCVNNGNGGYTNYEFACGDGTVWDQEIQSCNHASDINNCPRSTSSPLQHTTEITLSTSTTESQQEYSSTKPEPISNNRCTSEGFYANLIDCKKFYRCVDNGNGGFTKYDFACGEGTIWVQDLQTCDHDNGISNCSEVNISGSQETNIEQTTTTSSEIPTKEHDEYPSKPSNVSSTSQEECTAEGFYPCKNDCIRFYRCVDNGNGGYTKYDFTCGEGTAWDSNLQTCNHKNEVQGCQESSHSNPAEHDEVTTESSTTKSSSSEPTNESPKPVKMDICEQEGYYGDRDDCQKFYRCVDNGNGGYIKYDFTCGEGTIWDQDITTCNHPQDVKNPSCEQSGRPTMSSGSTLLTSSSTESTSSTTQNNEDCSQEETSKKPANKDVNCTKAGFYADPNDCKKFYRCVDWDGEGQKFSVFYFECGEGTIWDPALDTCNHEDSVYPPRDCNKLQSQNESSSQKPTESTSTTQEESTTSQYNNTTNTQATTEEQTTTQQSTTQKQTASEQTTTQPSSTTKQTTTEQSTTIDNTTTQKTTTSEPTTSQEPTTTEQITTQQSTTSEQSIIQESTTKQTTEQTTTQQSTTASEDMTTQQSTTREENTTQQSTTEQTMTDSTTDSSTDQQSTSQSNETTEQTTPVTEQQTESLTTEQESTTENETTESSSQEKECPETDDDQHVFVCPTSFRRHPKYCNLFYQCEEDDDSHEVKIAVFKCPNETIYDETKTKCVEKNKVDKKCDGEMAKKHRIKRFDVTYKEPVTVSKENFSCPAIGNFPLENEECSPAFLKCQTSKSGKLRGLVYQCPEGYLYWSISKRCEQQFNIKFCKKSKTNWYRRWEIPVERRNLAK